MFDSLCPAALGLLELIANGPAKSNGDIQVLEKGIKFFADFVSEDIEECIDHAIQNKVAVWDFYDNFSSDDDWHPQVNHLWVSYLCNYSNLHCKHM